MSRSHYASNPLIHRNRELGQQQPSWVSSFCCKDMRPLIICRGPIRKETMDIFSEMGINEFGILLSEKDSITYPNALSPELRSLTNPDSIHRVPDYTGATKEERIQRIEQIIKIAKENNYNAIFAGYGFMAEDEEMVASMENAGLNFIGPCSQTVHSAGLKDEAKRTALKMGVSVTPGIDNATALALLEKHPDIAALKAVVKKHKLNVDASQLNDKGIALEDMADLVLSASYDAGIDLYTVEELQQQIQKAVVDMYQRYPENRIRLKAIGGGGGKGQRILAAPSSYQGSQEKKVSLAANKAPELVLEILNEVKTTGVGDNKNVLVELNIETTRHQEIQVVGNGEWCITMGARDCSLQMHEQKLLEVSSTHESIVRSIKEAENGLASGVETQAALDTLKQDLITLDAMEDEASNFGAAVGLDSVSTFECIVDRGSHFFMEMNTRIQVEHRVTELCYELEFINPDNPNESFVVDSLVELMVLLARHAKQLPKPVRHVRKNTSVEARLNATNSALQPHAGGLINFWSRPHEDEIRDDQGISIHNPDTGVFVQYKLAGAYDSNIALILTHGDDRLDSYQRLSQIIRQTNLMGEDLCTNLEFHYGLVNWFIGAHIQARPTTKFIVPYLAAVGLLKQYANNIDLNFAFKTVRGAAQTVVEKKNTGAVASLIDRKQSLILRPIEKIFSRPHSLSGWLSLHRNDFEIKQTDGEPCIKWLTNPVQLLEELYYYLNMEFHPVRAAQDVIWDHDAIVLTSAVEFYKELDERFDFETFAELNKALASHTTPSSSGLNKKQWLDVKAAHQGYQLGMDLLKVLPFIAAKTNFYALKIADNLSIDIPEHLLDAKLQKDMEKVLVPPVKAKSDEIAAVSGGMFYPREAPGLDVYVNEGDHFEAGDVLYIVEVMKMFNKVLAPFAGTIEKMLVKDDGVIIAKGQTLFKVKPDEEIVFEAPEEIIKRKHESTASFLSSNCA